jgi:hypothetical protein
LHHHQDVVVQEEKDVSWMAVASRLKVSDLILKLTAPALIRKAKKREGMAQKPSIARKKAELTERE